MGKVPRKRRLGLKARRALDLLANISQGVTEARMHALGFSTTILAGLVRARLATAERVVIEPGGAPIKFERYRITAAGLKALEDYRALTPDAR
jgi:hypothetical protein